MWYLRTPNLNPRIRGIDSEPGVPLADDATEETARVAAEALMVALGLAQGKLVLVPDDIVVATGADVDLDEKSAAIRVAESKKSRQDQIAAEASAEAARLEAEIAELKR